MLTTAINPKRINPQHTTHTITTSVITIIEKSAILTNCQN